MKTFTGAIQVCVFLFIVPCCWAQLITPCPEVLTYDMSGSQNDRWFAEIKFISNTSLSGFWLDIVLTEKAHLLGNYVAEVVTSDNTEYSIQNFKRKVNASEEISVRFFVKYSAGGPVPAVRIIRLNGKEICSDVKNNIQIENITESTIAPDIPTSTLTPTTSTTEISSTSLTVNLTERFQPTEEPPRTTVVPVEEVNCGTVDTSIDSAQWPWHATLYKIKGVDLLYYCGASLISHTAALTAAHCVTRKRLSTPTGRYALYLGRYRRKQWEGHEQTVQVTQIIVHPDYNEKYTDIAIVKFNSISFSKFIRPVCLWVDNDLTFTNLIGRNGSVISWGYDETGRVTDELAEAAMPVIDLAMCLKLYPEYTPNLTTNLTYCAGYEDDNGICNGDSGSGMVFKEDTVTDSPIWRLRGLVSIGVTRYNGYACDSKHYLVFTDVAKFNTWIKQNM